jgi:hypothetical protein
VCAVLLFTACGEGAGGGGGGGSIDIPLAPNPQVYTARVQKPIPHGSLYLDKVSREGGRIESHKESITAFPEDEIWVRFSHEPYYRIKPGSLKYNGIPIPYYTFFMPAANVLVSGEFERVYGIYVLFFGKDARDETIELTPLGDDPLGLDDEITVYISVEDDEEDVFTVTVRQWVFDGRQVTDDIIRINGGDPARPGGTDINEFSVCLRELANSYGWALTAGTHSITAIVEGTSGCYYSKTITFRI